MMDFYRILYWLVDKYVMGSEVTYMYEIDM